MVIKCVFCNGRSSKGVHDVCWKEFKGFMLSDRVSFDIAERDEAYDEPKQTNQENPPASI